jgi:ubiquinone/menaquinone biosynthesis C-methylase UbiE
LLEFTGERLVPGQVDRDLWNEHLARYLFASRLARRKRVLDIACGMGYGSAELAKSATSVCGIDLAPDAVSGARERYASHNIAFLAASGTQLPFRDATFDLVVAFEVIEHLEHWDNLLLEARRLLAPGGQFVISTPNQSYYAETRKLAGPNPFHVREFDYGEFRSALASHFTSVTLYLQNHAAAISIQPDHAHHAAELAVEPSTPTPEEAHFFIAVCALAPQTGSPLYVYLPAAANVLKERESHIAKLEDELSRKDDWLQQLKLDHSALLQAHHELEEKQASTVAWARQLDQEVAIARQRLAELEEEILQMRLAAAETVAGYEAKIAEVESELAQRTQDAESNVGRLEKELSDKTAELAECVKLLHAAEDTAESRTAWAQALDARISEMESILSAAGNSRWLRLGRKLGVGPRIAS